MSFSVIIIVLFALLLLGYFVGRKRSIYVSENNTRPLLHSLPQYYGYLVALWSCLPALLVLLVWTALDSSVISSMTISYFPEQMQQLSKDDLSLLVNEIINLSELKEALQDNIKQAVVSKYLHLVELSQQLKVGVVLILVFVGMFIGFRLVKPQTRAAKLSREISMLDDDCLRINSSLNNHWYCFFCCVWDCSIFQECAYF